MSLGLLRPHCFSSIDSLRSNYWWESYLCHQKGSCTKKQQSLWSVSPSGYSCCNSFWCPKDQHRSVWETKTHNQSQWLTVLNVSVIHWLTNKWVYTDVKDMHSMYTILLSVHISRPTHNYAPLHHRSCCLPQGMRSPHPPQQSSGRRELWCT